MARTLVELKVDSNYCDILLAGKPVSVTPLGEPLIVGSCFPHNAKLLKELEDSLDNLLAIEPKNLENRKIGVVIGAAIKAADEYNHKREYPVQFYSIE